MIKKIAIVLYTNGLQYDDRVRKEIQSMQLADDKLKFFIYCLTPEKNEYEGVTAYGVPYKNLGLFFRRILPSKHFLFLKAFELYFYLYRILKKEYDLLWFADPETFLFPLLLKNKMIIWDLHELPMLLCKSQFSKMLFHRIERNCCCILHANQERIDYLVNNKAIKQVEKHFPIRNLPDKEIDLPINIEDESKLIEFEEWVDTKTCVYLQGIGSNARKGEEILSAICGINDLYAVVVGNFNPDIKNALQEKYGALIDERFFWAGMISQHVTYKYIRKCKFGIVFYSALSPNNYLCESNRMYQILCCGKPVIVGCNPTMKNYIIGNSYGIALDDDGSDIERIQKGIFELLQEYDFYVNNILGSKDMLYWDIYNSFFEDMLGNINERHSLECIKH